MYIFTDYFLSCKFGEKALLSPDGKFMAKLWKIALLAFGILLPTGLFAQSYTLSGRVTE